MNKTAQWEKKMKKQKQKKLCKLRKNRIYILCLCMLLAVLFKNIPVLAAGEAEKEESISVLCPVEGMKLSLYRVAEYEDTGSLSLTETFLAYPVSLEQTEQAGWQGAADTLAACIRRDGIKADAVAEAKADKKACFTKLSGGLYLVIGQPLEVEEEKKTQVYTPQVALIALPDASKETVPAQITAVLKYEKKEADTQGYNKLQVVKVWKQDDKKNRPDAIQVELLQTDAKGNTTIADRQTLDEDNQWSYTWEKLSAKAHWSVTEAQVPSGYTESTQREGDTVVLTNTAKKAAQTRQEDTAPGQTKELSKKLPQTGQRWWPIPLLLLAGICCLLSGRALRQSAQEKKDVY